MPITLHQGFEDFHRRLYTTRAESQAVADHRRSIENCLDATLQITGFFRAGSFQNGTHVSGFSDVDYFSILPSNRPVGSSAALLETVREALDTHFPAAGVRVAGPAVIVPFGPTISDGTRIVPAVATDKSASGHPVYEIPDCAGGWTEAAPDAHNSCLAESDTRLAGRLKPLIRFAKAWKYHQAVPIRSYYLERILTKHLKDEIDISYSRALLSVFRHLEGIGLSDVSDLMGVSGPISPSDSDSSRQAARTKVASACSQAQEAVAAETAGEIEAAFDLWDLLFNYQFPPYG